MLGGQRPPPGRVVVYDGDGYLVGAALAELLAREGREVELVTGYATVAPFCAETLEDVLIRARLHECGVAIRTGTVLTGIEPGRLTCDDADGEPLELACRRRRARDPARLARRALPRARRTPRGGVPRSATASRRACSPRRSSTATGSRARSTATIPRSRCPTCASASATATSCRRPPNRPRWPFSRRARNPRGAPASSSTTPPPPTARIDALLRSAGRRRGRGRGRGRRRGDRPRPAPGRALRLASRRLAPAGRGRPRDPRRARRRIRRDRRTPRLPRARHLGRTAAPRRHGRQRARSSRSTAIAVRASSSTPTSASRRTPAG